METKITYDPAKLDETTAALVEKLLREKGAVEEPELVKKNSVWSPQRSAVYFYLNPSGSVSWDGWTDHHVDHDRYASGNCFRTKEEAEFAAEQLKVVIELKRFAEEHNTAPIDWNNASQYKYTIRYNHKYNALIVEDWMSVQSPGVYFTSKTAAWDAIQTIGEARLKKYYFGSYEEQE
ncbi:MAG: hypothetical protein J6S14_15320 [Clostridia bacterium]|nr:hypothetical protein [Clostridia bacterium]